jgi:hypothetical protein
MLFPICPRDRIYESMATLDPRRVSKYCVVMLADYLTCVAALSTEASNAAGGAKDPSSDGDGYGIGIAAAAAAALPGLAAAALQRGAFSLLSCLGPAELQHLHTALGVGMAGARRAALASLRAQFDKSFKFEGKV